MPESEELAALFKAVVEPVITLVTTMIHSLEGKLDRRFDQLLLRYDAQSARLDRQAALIQTGSRWTTRMNEWNERIDKALEARDGKFLS